MDDQQHSSYVRQHRPHAQPIAAATSHCVHLHTLSDGLYTHHSYALHSVQILCALRRRFAAHTLHEPEAWHEWFASGIRFSRPAVAFYGGRPTFFFYGRTSTHKLPRRVQQLAQQLGIAEHMVILFILRLSINILNLDRNIGRARVPIRSAHISLQRR